MDEVYIGLGSNLGDREANLRAALRELSSRSQIRVIAVSPFVETRAVGGPAQRDFLNAVAGLSTSLEPMGLLRELHAIERKLGRRRALRWGPRAIDLDILLYGDAVIESDELRLPHPLMHARTFVLEPLAAIAPRLRHPVFGKNVAELLAEARRRESKGPPPDAPCHIAVAGPIAAGKTTLALLLAGHMQLTPLLEQAHRNPLLGAFYAERRRYALVTELWFLLHRFEQLREAASSRIRRIVTDYLFDQDMVFARMNLKAPEMEIYEAARALTIAGLPRPDVVICLEAASALLSRRVHERARPYELNLRGDYLAETAGAYDELFANYKAAPVISLRTDEPRWDFCADSEAVTRLARLIARHLPAEKWCVE